MPKRILKELRTHAPFTLFGALTGIAVMLVLVATKVRAASLVPVFEGLHALHILLSALVTAGLYRRYRKNVLACILIGLVGSIGIATLSDIVFPHHGGALLLSVAGGGRGMHPIHLAFIEEWWLILPAALIGSGLGMAWPRTKVPHAGHVLLSTWASLFYIVAYAEGGINWLPLLPLVFVVLFVAVWIPCCVSDIVFPLLFVGKDAEPHSHDHD